MRVVSLVPAATEITAALGRTADLVGVSRDCDWPPEVRRLPRVTRTRLGADLGGEAVDREVRTLLPDAGSLYALDDLARLRPDVILTQGLCAVCAPSGDAVREATAGINPAPRLLSLDPTRLAEVLADVRAVGDALGVPDRAAAVVASLEARIEAVRRRRANRRRVACVVLEWMAPPFASGFWTPELVAIAGGVDPLGRPGEPAREVAWDAVRAAAPDAIVIAACGWTVERALGDLPTLIARPGWAELPAVRARAVWVVDGTAHFSRPGPRLIDSLELLATVFDGEQPDGAIQVG